MARAGADRAVSSQLTRAQRSYLRRGIGQPGGKLPLFGPDGRQINHQTIRACIDSGWAEPWFNNPIKPDWLVCRLTDAGYRILGENPPESAL
ncbi:hypothetical protein [Microbaculum sp. FT89]|uniref:hypothetical protein n=1 Tax=Microbaculum sp. FT89 TaxID=3447298 RepID=UPI003F52EE2E